MSKKVISVLAGLIVLVASGIYYYNYSSKQDLIIAYIDESDRVTSDYVSLMIEEAMIEDYEELYTYTEEETLPKLNQLMGQLERISEEYDHAKILEVHEILIDSFNKAIEGNQLWLAEDFIQSDRLFVKSEELYIQYEDDLEKLANKWNVEIIWEESE
ncbi:hypothetical protein [Alkalihalobacillus sp. 1P02AB]|uniref:hypothetical protein n=1 Tax=Alkalihalobacillus sp. 1P02AB TaxID=3132260 RepID=UPI0039A41080